MRIKYLILLLILSNILNAQTTSVEKNISEKSTYGELENNFYKGKSGDDKIRKNNVRLG